ncbi:Rieske (2Fe-2S) protein [Micromonospora sp. KC606]|uniref:Rieske (2Fe-2S) protein n=1 Tax=Micromonospora sp. KC606 TaxID=2530379 RepID=UPI00104286F4|nr:Rieske (2Fe-2S) protein [Micromonospora sp. KC606]TDC81342.1 Rieske (2Fe-2S) protein [Micromonospora sp. KC606]
MSDDQGAGCRSRRAVLACAGAAGAGALLTGCQTYGQPQPVQNQPIGSADVPPAAPATNRPAGSAAGALATLAEIPVGGGKIFAAQKVVVTQPQPGTVKAFSATCTHQGCTVTSVKGGRIVCGCHNSQFDISDGSVKDGPANAPLAEAGVVLDGDAIRLA